LCDSFPPFFPGVFFPREPCELFPSSQEVRFFCNGEVFLQPPFPFFFLPVLGGISMSFSLRESAPPLRRNNVLFVPLLRLGQCRTLFLSRGIGRAFAANFLSHPPLPFLRSDQSEQSPRPERINRMIFFLVLRIKEVPIFSFPTSPSFQLSPMTAPSLEEECAVRSFPQCGSFFG